MTDFLPHYILYLIAITVAAFISVYTVRKILFITRNKKIYDIPDDTRKIHGAGIPSLGGTGIFIGYMVVAAFFRQPQWDLVFASSVILFFTGIYDDLANMRPYKKLLAQLVASMITVYFADVRLTTFYGLFGINEIPYWFSIAFTTFCCTFFINVFNFVDGIDGLACTIAILYTGLLGTLFTIVGAYHMAGIAFCIAGATAGLLYFNFPPAKIYMGDTGSMFLGFTIFVLTVLFIAAYRSNSNGIAGIIHTEQGCFAVLLSVIFLPVYDAIRVFILRASKGISPLKADRAHLHYYLLDAGFTHGQSVLIIVCCNVALIGLGWAMQDANLYITLAMLIAVSSVMLGVIYVLRQRRLNLAVAK